MELIDRLSKLWDDSGVTRNDGASTETIAAFEQAHSLSLPNADDYFVFADHSIWVNVYAVRLKGERSAMAPAAERCGSGAATMICELPHPSISPAPRDCNNDIYRRP